ncbi:MAG: PLDc N-terminal domain-containing protein, partial [Candidatus Methanoperedens sp.]|nr:PLDc N-terminal domain-containing protein [Candidatus Methanoperedens sp.]
MLTFLSLLLILAVIGIISGTIWIWKSKTNWSTLKKVAITVPLAIGLIAIVFIELIMWNGGGYLGQFLILILIILAGALIVLWLSMLIDCLKRPDGKFKPGGDNAKLIWIFVIIFTGFIGALIYYFLIKKT